jgi:hypothetical protein
MRIRQLLQLSFAMLYVAVCLWLLPPVEAGPPGKVTDVQLRAAIAQAVHLAHPGAGDETVKIQPRLDLDEDFSRITGKASGNVSFYETEAAPIVTSGSQNPVWAAVSGDSVQESYKLYSFESSDGFQRSSQEFSRLISQLTLSLDDDKATSMAHFFLGCCNRGTHGEIVADEDLMHHTVERDYLQIYGDVWRTLEASVDWWQGYQKSAFHFPPTVRAGNGAYLITVETIVASFGMHPQLQQWNFALSPDGRVTVLSAEAIYPKESRWLSYDFPSRIAPSIR